MFDKFQKFLVLLWFVPITLIYLHTTDSFDQDLGRHIKLGEIIWETKQVPKVNLFSYTNPNEPVFNSHWGSQVIFYLLHKHFGIAGLVLTNALINTLAFGTLFWLAARRSGILIPSLLFIPFSFMLLDRTWIRPEMFGNLFFSILLLSLFVEKIRKVVKWIMPFIALLWVNLHITAFLGVFVMVIVLAQDIFESKKRLRSFYTNGIILIFILLALLINPYGISAVVSASTLLSKYGYAIVENQSWFFLKDFGFPIVSHIFFGFLILVVSFLAAVVGGRRPFAGGIVLIVVISVLTFRFVRNEVLFAYSAFLVSCLNFSVFNKMIKQSPKIHLVVSFLIFILSIYLINNAHNQRGLPIGFGKKESYRTGVDFFINNSLKGPIFNNFDIGGYLIYRLYPDIAVFVDNRPEAYPVGFFQETYIPMQINHEIFKRVSKEYGIKTIIWGRRDITPWSRDFLNMIKNDSDWKLLYADEATLIYSK